MNLQNLEVRAGELRERVQLMQPAAGGDAHGRPGAPTLFAERWAYVNTMSGQELYRASQFTSEANRVVVMRWLPGLLPSMTVQMGSRTLQILYADDVQERHVKLVLYCQEVLS